MIFHALPNQGGGVLCRWRWRRQIGKLSQIVSKCNEERINDTNPVDARVRPNPAKNFTPVVFTRFVCALFRFSEHEFPTKCEKNLGHFYMTAPGMNPKYLHGSFEKITYL